MKTTQFNITDFKKNSSFYNELDLLITIKSFNLQAIRKRYIASRSNKIGKTGSVERRKPAKGGIASLKLKSGKIEKLSIIAELHEPRGIHYTDSLLAVATENSVHIIQKDGISFRLNSPWFSYIHTVEFNPNNPDLILISSSGFDLIQEYNYKKNELTFEWLAWEHGFNEAFDPTTKEKVFLTRSPQEANQFARSKKNFFLIKNPTTDHLPTAKRAAFINSACYHPKDSSVFIATFFHEGKVYKINKNDKKATAVIEDLKNPHGGHFANNSFMATSTTNGQFVVLNKEEKKILDFASLPGKSQELGSMEWIQNTISYGDLFVAIDSNRTSFIIFDLKKRLYDKISFDADWAVQDTVPGKVSEKQLDILLKL